MGPPPPGRMTVIAKVKALTHSPLYDSASGREKAKSEWTNSTPPLAAQARAACGGHELGSGRALRSKLTTSRSPAESTASPLSGSLAARRAIAGKAGCLRVALLRDAGALSSGERRSPTTRTPTEWCRYRDGAALALMVIVKVDVSAHSPIREGAR